MTELRSSFRGWGSTMAVASAGLTLFGLYSQGMVISGHARGVDALAEHLSRPLAVPVLYAAAIVCGLWFSLPRAWRSVRRGRPDLDIALTAVVLVVASVGAWLPAAVTAGLAGGWSALRHRRGRQSPSSRKE